MGEPAGEALGEGRPGIGDQVVEALPTGAISGQVRRDQIPSPDPPPAVTGAGVVVCGAALD